MNVIKKLFGIGIAGLALIGVESMYENRTLCVEEYPMYSMRIPKAFDGYRIAFLSDLHDSEFGKDNEELIGRIDELQPDLILVGGDMMIAKPGHDTEKAEHLLQVLSSRYPVIHADGNHEFRLKLYPETYGNLYSYYVQSLKDMGVTYLSNQSVKISRGGSDIYITGLSIGRGFYRRGPKLPMSTGYVDSEIGPKKKEYQILLAHNPIYFPTYAKWGADLVLSGHNHGGLIRIPGLGGAVSPQIRIFAIFDAGRYVKKGSTMIISRGLGTHTFRIRVNNLPELSMITLHHGKEEHYGN